MRSCTGAISALAAVVGMQPLGSHSASGAGRQASNTPAGASTAPSHALKYQGCLPPAAACHS